MPAWSDFEAAAPALADAVRRRLDAHAHKTLATVRKDGSPRVHPVCPVLSGDRLFVLVTHASPKRQDLLRDGRYSLQAFPQPKAGSDEFYVAGKAPWSTTRRRVAQLFETRSTWPTRRRSFSSCGLIGSCARRGRTC